MSEDGFVYDEEADEDGLEVEYCYCGDPITLCGECEEDE